ncbi:MAG: flagellar motor protein [Armatimonadota bacterium]|nr:flagellar motor protein [Armatimonadota bacterium]
MDLATVIGLALGWGALMIALIMEGGSLGDLVNPSAFVLVFGGTLGATTVAFSLKQILSVPGVVRNAFFCKDTDMPRLIRSIVDFARTARREGILSLENEVKAVDNKFLQMGVRLVVDGTPSEMVREILETEIVSLQERHKVGENIFATMGGFAPTLGIIGTVMGLIHMLASLDKPGAMGPAIAAAFIATLYGVALANLVFLPIGSKLKARTTEEIIAYDMMVEGILSLQAGDNPRMVETKMGSGVS